MRTGVGCSSARPCLAAVAAQARWGGEWPKLPGREGQCTQKAPTRLRGAQFLRQQGLFESREELQQREDVLGRLAAVAVDWVRAVTRALALGDDFADMSHAKIQTFGSYRLGVHGPGAARRAGGAGCDGAGVRLGCLHEALPGAVLARLAARPQQLRAQLAGYMRLVPCCLAGMQPGPSALAVRQVGARSRARADRGCAWGARRGHRHAVHRPAARHARGPLLRPGAVLLGAHPHGARPPRALAQTVVMKVVGSPGRTMSSGAAPEGQANLRRQLRYGRQPEDGTDSKTLLGLKNRVVVRVRNNCPIYLSRARRTCRR